MSGASRRRSALAAAATLVTGCFLPSFEVGTGEGGSGGGGGSAPQCESATYQAVEHSQSSPEDPVDFFVALRVVNLGDEMPATRPGFDLDGACTCCTGCEERPSCTPPAGAEDRACDEVGGSANGGRDNSFALAVGGIDEINGGGAVGSSALRGAIGSGRWTVLLRVFHYNGTANDDKVSVALYRTPGLAQGEPTWDGSDVWPVRIDSLGGEGLDSALVVNHDAYVVNNALVAKWSVDRLSLLLASELLVTLDEGVLQATLEPEGPRFGLVDGTIAGVWPTAAVFSALGGMRRDLLPMVCTDTPGYDAQVRTPLCLSRDSAVAQPPTACNAISFGMGFVASPVADPPIEPFIDDSTGCVGTSPVDDCP